MIDASLFLLYSLLFLLNWQILFMEKSRYKQKYSNKKSPSSKEVIFHQTMLKTFSEYHAF
jgi:hypothetical protein